VEYRILGPLELEDRGGPTSIAAPKERALLGVLLLHPNEPVSAARLIDELWGDHPPAKAGKIVQTYVSQLRRRFGAALIETRPPGYLIPVEARALDANRFRGLVAEAREHAGRGETDDAAVFYRDALALWRGSPLADVTFESYARNEVDRLEGERLKALTDRIDCELDLGRQEELIPELESLVAQHPLQERLRAQLMLALYRSGRQADALAAYQGARRTLVDELGLEPGPELHELERAILRQDPELQAPKRPVAWSIRVGRPRWVVAAFVTVAAAAAIGLVSPSFFGSDAAGISSISANAVGVVDPETNELVAEVPVGIGPRALVVSRGAAWVANTQDQTVSRIDPHTRRVVRTYSVADYPSDLATGEGALWVALGPRALLSRISPGQGAKAGSPPVSALGNRDLSCARSGANVAVGMGSVWLACELGELGRLNPDTGRARRVGYEADLLSSSSAVAPRYTDLAVGLGSLWIANGAANSIIQLDPRTNEWRAIDVGQAPSALAIANGSVWVANLGADTVSRVEVGGPTDPPTVTTISVGKGPAAVAAGYGSVWVANRQSGTVSRIDPDRGEVVATIAVGAAPVALAVGAGAVWVNVRASEEAGS
jgi:YVTN family beta-propeller protein